MILCVMFSNLQGLDGQPGSPGENGIPGSTGRPGKMVRMFSIRMLYWRELYLCLHRDYLDLTGQQDPPGSLVARDCPETM